MVQERAEKQPMNLFLSPLIKKKKKKKERKKLGEHSVKI